MTRGTDRAFSAGTFDVLVANAALRCFTLVLSRCCPALAFSSLFLFLKCLAMCFWSYRRNILCPTGLSVATSFSFFELFSFPLPLPFPCCPFLRPLSSSPRPTSNQLTSMFLPVAWWWISGACVTGSSVSSVAAIKVPFQNCLCERHMRPYYQGDAAGFGRHHVRTTRKWLQSRLMKSGKLKMLDGESRRMFRQSQSTKCFLLLFGNYWLPSFFHLLLLLSIFAALVFFSTKLVL